MKRICLYAGPGAGKTSLAMELASELKKQHLSVEYVDEHIKQWAYEGKTPKGTDQLYLMVQQMQKEERYLLNKVKFIVTDCPILLVHAYTRIYAPYADDLDQFISRYEKQYDAVHIFLERDGIPYNQHGRYETYDGALVMDQKIKDILNQFIGTYHTFKTKEGSKIIDFVKSICIE